MTVSIPIDSKTDTANLIALGAHMAVAKPNPHPHGRAYVVLPNGVGGMQVEYLERPTLPPRKVGIVSVEDVESLMQYTNRHLDPERTVIYANLQPACFNAILNDHMGGTAADTAGWGDHGCYFALKHSQEFDEWKGHQRHQFAQVEFADFIERNLPDFIEPAGAKMYELALNFRAKQEVAYSGAIRTTSGDIELSYTARTHDAGGGVPTASAGKMAFPSQVKISLPVWAGLGQKRYDFLARLRYRLGNGVVHFSYELDRPHKVVETAFSDLLAKVKEGVKAPVIFGTTQIRK